MTNYWDINKRRGGYIAHPINPNRASWYYCFTIQSYADPRGHTRSIWSDGDLKWLFVYCHFLQPLFSFFNFFFFNFLAIYIHYVELGHLLHLLVSLYSMTGVREPYDRRRTKLIQLSSRWVKKECQTEYDASEAYRYYIVHNLSI